MTITYHPEMIQGSDEWLAIRCGLLTASEMKNIISPVKLEPVKEPAHLYELLSQRITGYVEPQYISDDMLRGITDEVEAKILYANTYAPVTECGFITNNKWGFTIGYSPDGLVDEYGLIECKSRRQKFQVETILSAAMPADFRIQVQTGLLVSERQWLDFISYSAGLPMMTLRVYPDAEIQAKIVAAATVFEDKLAGMAYEYKKRLADGLIALLPTERKPPEQEITV